MESAISAGSVSSNNGVVHEFISHRGSHFRKASPTVLSSSRDILGVVLQTLNDMWFGAVFFKSLDWIQGHRLEPEMIVILFSQSFLTRGLRGCC